MYKQTFYKDDDFQIWYEMEQGELLVHIGIFKATKQTMERALAVWADFKAKAYFDGFERIITYTRDERVFKWFPFAERKGDFTLGGRKYGVWQWALNYC
jgi:hypothetical protein